MRRFLPRRLEPIAFGLMLTCIMTFSVSGLSTVLATGVHAGLPLLWLRAWMSSWAIAFPIVLFVAPFVRRVLDRIVLPG